MAEDVPKGKLPAIAHKPSRLRNQIQPDSSDDELILVPRSDTIIPETQLGHFKHFAGAADKVLGYSNDSEVDYDDSAFLNRVGVKKSTRDGTSQAVLGNLYSKDALMSNPSHSNSFSFEPCKSIGKFPKGGDDCVLQPETNPGFAAHLEPVQGHARNGNITVVTSKVRSQIGNSLNTHEEITGSETKHQTTEPACSPTATPVAYHDTAALNAGFQSSRVVSGTPTSAQPSARNGRKGKKGKKVERSLLPQKSNVPWPSRSPHAANPSMPGTGHNQLDVLADTHNTEHGVDHVNATSRAKSLEVLARNGIDHDIRKETASPESMLENHEMLPEASNPFPQECQMTISSQVAPAASDLSSIVSVEQFASTLSDRPHRDNSPQSTHDCTESTTRTPIQQDVLLPLAAGPMLSLPGMHASQSGDLDPGDETIARGDATQRREGEAVLHGTIDRGAARRVSKPPRKMRAASKLLPHRPHLSTVERSMEDLRVALLADQFRTNHKQSTSVKHHEEITEALRDHITLQDATIVDWKGRYAGLGDRVKCLTTKATTNQNYVTGLQKDYEKLKKSVGVYHTQAKTILQGKIDEIEGEKAFLRSELGETLDILTKSHNNMKSTMRELSDRLIQSENKEMALVRDLHEEKKMHQEQQKKCEYLEKQLLSSIQIMQQQINIESTAITSKLESVQSSLMDVTSDDDDRNSDIKHCLVILRHFQQTPFLARKDVQQAEGMLHSMHESVNKNLEALSEAVSSKFNPTQDLQLFIKDQLQGFRVQLVKADEAAAETREAQDTSNALGKKLETEQQRYSGLYDQLTTLREEKRNIEFQSAQLKRELEDLKVKTLERHSDLVTMEQELTISREHVRKTRGHLEAAQKQAQQMEHLQEAQEKKAAMYKDMYEKCREVLTKVDAENAQLKEHTASMSDMRRASSNDMQKEIERQESGYDAEIDRLTPERHAGQQDRLGLKEELKGVRNQLRELREEYETLGAITSIERQKKAKVEVNRVAAQLARQDSPSQASRITILEGQLRKSVEELDAKTQDFTSIKSRFTDLFDKFSDLQGLYDQLQIRASRYQSEIEALRHKEDDKQTKIQGQPRVALQFAQDQTPSVQKEQQVISNKLKQACTEAPRPNDVHATHSLKQNSLQQRAVELQVEVQAQDAEAISVGAEAVEVHQKSTDKHRAATDELDHRQALTDAASVGAKAVFGCSKDGNQIQLHVISEKTEATVQHLAAIWEHGADKAKAKKNSSESYIPKAHSDSEMPSLHAARKKVNRQNRLALDVMVTPGSVHRRPCPTPRSEPPCAQQAESELYESLFEEHARVEHALNDLEPILVNPGRESVPDTQAFGGVSMSLDEFDADLKQASKRELQRQTTGSSDLSTISSENMGKELGPQPTQMLCGRDRSSKSVRQSRECFEAIIRSDAVSETSSRSSGSNERPKSQANTASRMMPPPAGIAIKHFVAYSRSQDAAKDATHRCNVNGKAHGQRDSSSPDLEYSPSPDKPKHKYGRQGVQHSDSQEHGQKRKDPARQQEEATMTKKQRTHLERDTADRLPISKKGTVSLSTSAIVSSQLGTQIVADPPLVNHRSKSQSSSSNGLVHQPGQHPITRSSQRVRNQARLPSATQNGGSPRRNQSSRLTRSKSKSINEPFDDRFDQELGAR